MIRPLTLKYWVSVSLFHGSVSRHSVGVLTYLMYNMIETFKPSVVLSYS